MFISVLTDIDVIIRKECFMIDKNKKTLKNIILIAVFLLIAALAAGIRLYYEYLLYLDIGYKYTTIFFTNLRVRCVSLAISFMTVFLILIVNNFILRHISYKYNDDWEFIKKPVYTVVVTFLLSLLASTFISGGTYENVLTFMYGGSFGSVDPLFGKDIGYYMFIRPFYMNVVDSVKCVLAINIIYTVIVYALLWMRGGIGGLKDMVKNRHVLAHTLINIMLFIIVVALGYKFSIEELMYKSFCGVTGAGASHMKIWYPYYRIAPFMLIVIVPLAIYFLSKRRFKRAAWTVASFPIIWIGAVFCAVTYQAMIVDSDELNNERQYLEYNIDMTKRAYGLDSVEAKSYDGGGAVTSADIPEIRSIADSVDISDTSAILDVYNSEQQLQSEYAFYDADTVPYIIDGKRVMVSVSAREISGAGRSEDTYSGSKFLNTCGSGMVMTSSAAEKGKYFIYGIPAVSDMGIAGIANDKIYYGESKNGTVVVNMSYDDENYIGVGGVQLTPFNRMVIGLCSGDFKLMANSGITVKSRALMNRNIVERVKKIAPFFEYDSDPYLIVDDNGVMKWVMDAYSVSDKYPYSQKTGGINYISPCAKVIIDAYSGIVDFYVINSHEPMMQMYKKIYPYVFSEGTLPDTIKNYMRYPKDVFNIQADIYRKYYLGNASRFYSGTGVLEKVKTKETGASYTDAWYTIIGGKANVMLPYTKNGENICAYLTASCEPSSYGGLTITFINGDALDGTARVQNIINSSERIRKYINSLGSSGGTVRQGAVRMLLVNKTAIFAAPLYITGAGGGQNTAVSDVIVVMNGRAEVSSNIETAVKTILTQSSPEYTDDSASEEKADGELLNQLISLYKRVRAYQRAGDWENYGRAMKEFDGVMKVLEEKNNDRSFEENFVGPRKIGEQ